LLLWLLLLLLGGGGWGGGEVGVRKITNFLNKYKHGLLQAQTLFEPIEKRQARGTTTPLDDTGSAEHFVQRDPLDRKTFSNPYGGKVS
jgi:hypothetical protein